MNYHNITHDDMLNGDGLRVVLWVAGCGHNCKGCHNPETHDPDSGIHFDESAFNEIMTELANPYISGLTFSGGDPMHHNNVHIVSFIAKTVKFKYPNKTIWLYTGYPWEIVKDHYLMQYIDVLVDGRFIETKADEGYPWAGSTNQRVIDVQKSLETNKVVLWR